MFGLHDISEGIVMIEYIGATGVAGVAVAVTWPGLLPRDPLGVPCCRDAA